MAGLRAAWKSRRVQIWAILLLLLAGSIGLLLAAQQARRQAPPAPATPAPRPLRIRVVGEDGHPVPEAQAFVAQAAGALAEQAGRWSAEEGTLTVPPSETGRTLIVQARGHRSLRVDGVREDRTLVLRPGLLVRLSVTGDPVLPGRPYRLYLQVRPDPPAAPALTPEQQEALVGLMAAIEPPPADVGELPREGFGFAVSAEQAHRGVRLPVAGRYGVRWGLLHDGERRWYSLAEGTTVPIDVADQDAPQAFTIPVGTADIERTQRELDATLARDG